MPSTCSGIEEVIGNVQYLNWCLKAPKGEPSSYCDKVRAAWNMGIEKYGEQAPEVRERVGAALGEAVCFRMLEAVVRVEKWNEYGRQSIL